MKLNNIDIIIELKLPLQHGSTWHCVVPYASDIFFSSGKFLCNLDWTAKWKRQHK